MADGLLTDIYNRQALIPEVTLQEVSLPKVNLPNVTLRLSEFDPLENAKANQKQRGIEQVEQAAETQQFDPTEVVFNHLAVLEGSGDNVTDIPTGNLGVTSVARQAVNAPDDMPDEEVAREYLALLNRQWGMRKGFNEAPPELQAMLIDASYNMGEQVLNNSYFPKLNKALMEGKYDEVSKQLLDTANVGGQSVKGLAKRRALSYNLANPDNPISEVEQLKDGTIIYRDMKGGELLSYRPDGGKHEASEAGRLPL
ncbi:endolysin [Vibrio phage vB_ValC_WD615]|nr:endolysin [Vibrio phage vB_ValC_WD615]BBI55055.1 endolysin [Vibrio phage KIT05]